MPFVRNAMPFFRIRHAVFPDYANTFREYLRKMKKHFNQVEKLTKQIKEEYTSQNKPVPTELTENLKKSYVELVQKTEKYISLKKLQPDTTRGQKRLDFANELLNFAYETMEMIPEEFDKSAKADAYLPLIKDDPELDMNL